MQSKLVDSLVLNSVAASNGDVTVTNGELVFTGMATTIPINKILTASGVGLQHDDYAAGTPKKITVTFDQTKMDALEDGTIITMLITKNPVNRSNNFIQTDKYSAPEKYAVELAASMTDDSMATAFAAAVTAQISAGGSLFTTAIATANAIALLASDALADFQVTFDIDIVTSTVVTTALVKPSGTYAQVVAINSNADSAKTYDTITIRWIDNVDNTDVFASGPAEDYKEVRIFCDSSDGDSDDLWAFVGDILNP